MKYIECYVDIKQSVTIFIDIDTCNLTNLSLDDKKNKEGNMPMCYFI